MSRVSGMLAVVEGRAALIRGVLLPTHSHLLALLQSRLPALALHRRPRPEALLRLL